MVAALHRKSIECFGGIEGLRDRGIVESALAAGENAFIYGRGDLHEIAAAYTYHLAQNQGFLDGNKRTAVACAITFLMCNGCDDCSDDSVLYSAMIAIAEHRMDKQALAAVLRRQFPKAP
ncbi:type II toxin-antitoxin system death-on-curing family toxin [Opitutus terrae]|uniref:type II toxin-antitoxin system death-on-curing family toxin n=1 Tax=Opitutus terrae TaxID=107709 RepID=UPI0005D0FB54